ncbi:MAG: hypothetical protein AAFV96_12890, partial [Pseudomonadota bacterium]
MRELIAGRATHWRPEDDADGSAPAAVSATVFQGIAQGPTVRAYPDRGPRLVVSFGWGEETVDDVWGGESNAHELLVLPGFERSRVPMAEIDITDSSQIAAHLHAAIGFFHVPLGQEGYSAPPLIERAMEPEQTADGRLVLRHYWQDAQHRDLIGIVCQGPHRLLPDGALWAASQEAFGEGAMASALAPLIRGNEALGSSVTALYLGETLYPVGAISSEPGSQAADLAARRRAAIEETRAQTLQLDEDEAAEAYGLGWALPVAGDALLDGARNIEVSPAGVVAFLELRQKLAEVPSAATALALLGARLDSFVDFARHAPVIHAVLADETVAAAVRHWTARPLHLRGEPGSAAGDEPLPALVAAAFSDLTGRWVRRRESAAQQWALWRLFGRRADLELLRQERLIIDDAVPEIEDVGAVLEAVAKPEDRRAAAAISEEMRGSGSQSESRRSGERSSADGGDAGATIARLFPGSDGGSHRLSLSDAAAHAQQIRAAREVVAKDLALLRRCFSEAQLPAPASADEVWRRAAASDRMTEAARDRDAEGAREREVLENYADQPEIELTYRSLRTRVARQEALLGLSRYAESAPHLDRIYWPMGAALAVGRNAPSSLSRRDIMAELRQLRAGTAPLGWRQGLGTAGE